MKYIKKACTLMVPYFLNSDRDQINRSCDKQPGYVTWVDYVNLFMSVTFKHKNYFISFFIAREVCEEKIERKVLTKAQPKTLPRIICYSFLASFFLESIIGPDNTCH